MTNWVVFRGLPDSSLTLALAVTITLDWEGSKDDGFWTILWRSGGGRLIVI